MARYKVVDMSLWLLPVDLEAQSVPGLFAYAIHHVVDKLDLHAFDAHYGNDEAGASAYAPAMLLKAVSLAHSQGMVSSRTIKRAYCDRVLLIELTGDANPIFTRIANFVSRSHDAIASVFSSALILLRNAARFIWLSLEMNPTVFPLGVADGFPLSEILNWTGKTPLKPIGYSAWLERSVH